MHGLALAPSTTQAYLQGGTLTGWYFTQARHCLPHLFQVMVFDFLDDH